MPLFPKGRPALKQGQGWLEGGRIYLMKQVFYRAKKLKIILVCPSGFLMFPFRYFLPGMEPSYPHQILGSCGSRPLRNIPSSQGI